MAPRRTRPALSGPALRSLRTLAQGKRVEPRSPQAADEYAHVVDAYVRAARELRDEREHAREQAALNLAVLATSHDAYIAIDADGRITAWNARAEEMFGWTTAIATGRSLARTIIRRRGAPPTRTASSASSRPARGASSTAASNSPCCTATARSSRST